MRRLRSFDGIFQIRCFDGIFHCVLCGLENSNLEHLVVIQFARSYSPGAEKTNTVRFVRVSLDIVTES